MTGHAGMHITIFDNNGIDDNKINLQIKLSLIH